MPAWQQNILWCFAAPKKAHLTPPLTPKIASLFFHGNGQVCRNIPRLKTPDYNSSVHPVAVCDVFSAREVRVHGVEKCT